jgi:HK97 family phage prohead protease
MISLKRLPIEFDAKAVKDDGSFEGYASTFGNVDSGYDVAMPGCFANSLKLRPASAVKMLWQHDPAQPIGVWTDAKEDEHGLFVKGKLITDLQRGAEAHTLMKAGVINSMSIGYRTMEADFTSGGVRQLKEVGLFEISLVTFPMNEQATVTGMKDFDPREIEADLREAGLSRADAVKAVAIFKKTLREAGENANGNSRDAGDQARQAAQAATALRQLTEAFRI